MLYFSGIRSVITYAVLGTKIRPGMRVIVAAKKNMDATTIESYLPNFSAVKNILSVPSKRIRNKRKIIPIINPKSSTILLAKLFN